MPPVLMVPVVLRLLAQLPAGAVDTGSTRDGVSQILVAAIIVAVFVLLALEAAHRVLIIFCAVALLWVITYLTPWRLITFEAAERALDLNVLLLLAAMMAVVGVLKTTGVFAWAVSRLLQRSAGNALVIQGLLLWFTAILSSLADNVTTVIFATPMALSMATEIGVAPAAFLLPIVMAANVGGTATLIGDPPNIMIGSAAALSFGDFLIALAVPVGFMMILLERLSARYFRSELSIPAPERLQVTAVIRDPALLRWALVISGLIFVGFLTHGVTGMPAAVPAVIGAALLLLVQDVFEVRRQRPTDTERVHGLLHVLEKEIEWPTLAFFAFLFIAVGAAVQTGLIDTLAAGLSWLIDSGADRLHLGPAGILVFAALVIAWGSAVISALVDNIPFVAVSIPIVARLASSLPGDTRILWWALSLGACLGGNASPVGASANVTVTGLAERAGHRITFRAFLGFGVPTTILTLVVASVYLVSHALLGETVTVRFGAALLAAFLPIRILMGRHRAKHGPG